MDHQLGEEYEISFCCGRALAPAVDGGQDPLRLPQEPIHANGRDTGRLHRRILLPQVRSADAEHCTIHSRGRQVLLLRPTR